MAALSLSVLMVKPANAQSIPYPSEPQFSAKFVDSPYSLPATQGINPWTGQKITYPSNYVFNSSIELTIINQPFTSNVFNNLYYNVRMKGHYEVNWTDSYLTPNIQCTSNSQFTVLVYPILQCSNATLVYPIEQKYSNPPNAYANGDQIIQFPVGSKVDFQVQAMIGYLHPVYDTENFTGEISDWSQTQTVTIGQSSTVPEFPTLTILPLFSVILFSIVFMRKKTPKIDEV